MNAAIELQMLLQSPMAIEPSALPRIEAAARCAGGAAGARSYHRNTRNPPKASGGIAVINISGILSQRSSLLTALGLATSTQQVSLALRSALADDSVSAILLDIDSPGGSIYGIQELASEIYGARGIKPVVAFTESMAASAAYWLATQAGELYVSPGGEVGSIGVYQTHQDISKALEIEGIRLKIISAGKYKVEGNPYGPLDREARGFMQSRVNDYYSAFTRAVARGRGTTADKVRNGMGQGRLLGAADAKAQGMVDGIMSREDVMKKLKGRPVTSSARAAGRERQPMSTAERERLKFLLLH